MKKNTLSLILLCCVMAGFAQEKENLNLFETDSTWFKEIIKFPIGFAQEIEFEGFEDLRFPPGWAKKESSEFWSYMWAWSINDIKELTEKELETNIQFYFDGLMGINNSEFPKTNAIFIKKEISRGRKHVGKVKTFDTRFTNKPMVLNAIVETHFCESQNKAIIIFKFSPQDFYHNVWDTLNTVKLRDGFCED